MDQNSLSVEEFNALLQEWNGETIKVTKQELEDYDEALMTLTEVSYSKDTRRMDDYEPMHALHLSGTGKILTNPEEFQPFPSSYYEIPLEDSTKYQFDNARFSLVTNRGTYTIELADDHSV